MARVLELLFSRISRVRSQSGFCAVYVRFVYSCSETSITRFKIYFK